MFALFTELWAAVWLPLVRNAHALPRLSAEHSFPFHGCCPNDATGFEPWPHAIRYHDAVTPTSATTATVPPTAYGLWQWKLPSLWCRVSKPEADGPNPAIPYFSLQRLSAGWGIHG